MNDTARIFLSVFKLRIGVAITITALAGMAIAPGAAPDAWQVLVLALAVMLSSAGAGAFNQYVERRHDALMARTADRPFVTGRLKASGHWPAGIALLVLASFLAAALATNVPAAIYVFLGAFTYGVVYTVWLKRRTWLNIVLGGAAGSFAVLAGASAVDPALTAAPLILAVVLFLWTPPHFWSLAFVYQDQYRAAGVPMLPALVSARTAAWVILGHTVALVALSVLPVALGLGLVYFLCAALGGVWFVAAGVRFVRRPCRQTALANFHASLIQLVLLLAGVMLDPIVTG